MSWLDQEKVSVSRGGLGNQIIFVCSLIDQRETCLVL